MTTIEHLARVCARLARRCAALRVERDEAQQAEEAQRLRVIDVESAQLKCESELRDAKAKLAADEARAQRAEHDWEAAQDGIMRGSHDLEQAERERDAEKARADALQVAFNEARAIADKAEREVERLRNDYLTVADAVCRDSQSPHDCARQARETRAEVERLRGIITRGLECATIDDPRHATLRNVASILREADAQE